MDQDDDIQADWSSAELSVLRSAELDVPVGGSVERTLAAIGVGAAIGAGAGIGGAESLSAGMHLGRVTHGSLWLKWLSTALVAGGIAGAFFFARQRHEPARRNEASAPVVTAPPAASPPELVEPQAPSQASTSAPGANAPVNVTAPKAPVAPSARAAESKDLLAAEIQLIDEARDHLRQGDSAGALRTLTAYDQLVKQAGSMRAEATVIRIEAYQKSGATARAAALGQRFLSNNPNSPYADYVKRILARD